jgi:hypothetical protein
MNKTLLGETDAPPIKFNCPRCRKALQVAAIDAGTKKPCPACGQRLQVPAAPSAPTQVGLNKTLLASDETKAQPTGIQPGQPAVATRPVPARATASKSPASHSSALLIGGGVAAVGLVLLLLIGCVVSIFLINNSSSKRKAADLLALEAEMKALKEKEAEQSRAASKLREQEIAEAREREEQDAKARKERDDREEADRRLREEEQRLAKLKADAAAEEDRRRDQAERERRALEQEARDKELKVLQAKIDEARKQDDAKQMEEKKKKKVIVAGPGVILQTKGLLGPGMFNPHRNGSYCKVHAIPMKAGNTYVINLFSTWDNYLHLESPGGALLASDDDGGGYPNARIVFRCPADGVYRIIVSSFGANTTGPYGLRVEN